MHDQHPVETQRQDAIPAHASAVAQMDLRFHEQLAAFFPEARSGNNDALATVLIVIQGSAGLLRIHPRDGSPFQKRVPDHGVEQRVVDGHGQSDLLGLAQGVGGRRGGGD